MMDLWHGFSGWFLFSGVPISPMGLSGLGLTVAWIARRGGDAR